MGPDAGIGQGPVLGRRRSPTSHRGPCPQVQRRQRTWQGRSGGVRSSLTVMRTGSGLSEQASAAEAPGWCSGVDGSRPAGVGRRGKWEALGPAAPATARPQRGSLESRRGPRPWPSTASAHCSAGRPAGRPTSSAVSSVRPLDRRSRSRWRSPTLSGGYVAVSLGRWTFSGAGPGSGRAAVLADRPAPAADRRQ